MRTSLQIWRFVAGDTRSSPAGVALAVIAALVLTRIHAPAWSTPLVFTLAIACTLAAALAESG